MGKLIHLVLDNGQVLGIYFAESCRPHMTPSSTQFSSDLLEIKFSNGLGLAVDDPSGRSYLILDPILATIDDAFHPSLTVDYLKKSVRVYKPPSIKAYMLKERKFQGIGNTYADEVLWQIKVAPQSVWDKIPETKLAEMIDAIRATLIIAAEKIESITGPKELIADRYDFLKVHNTRKRYDPEGNLIMKIIIHRKRSYWTERQHIYC